LYSFLDVLREFIALLLGRRCVIC